jgi:ribosomal protein L10
MLEASGEMLVKFYNEKVAQAQGVMLRNFLGLLTQKVTDVRQEIFLLRDGIDII